MPWPKEHKEQTRRRIVDAATSAFRETGVADVGVGDIMRRAGLTHGGFYSHFDSKDDLLAEAIGPAMTDASASLDQLHGSPLKGLLETANAYLSPEHAAHPEVGCAIAALGPELSRGTSTVRQSLARAIHKRLGELVGLAPQHRSPERRKRDAAGAIACMVGGVIIARGMKQSERAAFLADCRAFLRDALAEADAAV